MKRIATTILFLIVGGCASHATVNSMGGDRAGGTITMGYTTNMSQKHPEDPRAEGQTEAEARCRAWGYNSAEAFGTYSRVCGGSSFSSYCDWKMIYQCLGDLEK